MGLSDVLFEFSQRPGKKWNCFPYGIAAVGSAYVKK
jgi:hypothetical protein